MIYAALVSWGMDSRAAEMKDYADFRANMHSNAAGFQSVEGASPSFSWTNRASVVQALSSLYGSLSLMKSGGKLVSNSKCLRFVFLGLCLPMDTVNTLQKLYGSFSESQAKFVEVLEFAYDVIAGIPNPQQYFDNQWNTCESIDFAEKPVVLQNPNLSPILQSVEHDCPSRPNALNPPAGTRGVQTNMPMTRILKRLYLGSASDADHLAISNPMGIRTVINVSTEKSERRRPGLSYLHYPIVDGATVEPSVFEKVMTAIARQLRSGTVLVHCSAGMSRSPVMVAVYLRYAGHECFDCALETISELRRLIDPNPVLVLSAKQYLRLWLKDAASGRDDQRMHRPS